MTGSPFLVVLFAANAIGFALAALSAIPSVGQSYTRMERAGWLAWAIGCGLLVPANLVGLLLQL